MDSQPPLLQPDIPNSPPPLTPPTNWRLYMELLSFAGLVFPLGNILGPVILWLVKKDTIPTVNEEGKKVINFNLSWTLWGIVTCGLGFIAWAVIAIIASLKAANNERFEHPLTIAFLK